MTGDFEQAPAPVGRSLFVIITGPSCTGKTTLARTLSNTFGLPLFFKDGFKEMMYDLAAPDGDFDTAIPREFSMLLGRFSLGCLEIAMRECAASGVSAIFEANFDRELFSPRLEAIRRDHPVSVVQANLRCDSAVLMERFAAREASDRHPGHGGKRNVHNFRPPGAEPLRLLDSDESFEIDTTHFETANYGPVRDAIASRIRGKA